MNDTISSNERLRLPDEREPLRFTFAELLYAIGFGISIGFLLGAYVLTP